MNDIISQTHKTCYSFLQQFINLSVDPICLRENSGEFLICNHSFTEKLLGNLKLAEWLSTLDFETSYKLSALELEAYALECGVIMEENINLRGKQWDFIITKLTIDGIAMTIWQFSRIYRKVVANNKFEPGLTAAIDRLQKLVEELKESHKSNLSLYCLGASHSLIARILNISTGTSKNRIKYIQDRLLIDSREELFILFHVSGISVLLYKRTLQCITRNVNRLLKK